jgi:hypothetical protein
MLKTWNIVKTHEGVVVWKELDTINNLNEIEQIKNDLGAEALFCEKTNSVVFKPLNEIDVPKNTNYSQLELVSRYLEPTSKFNNNILHS